MEATNNSNAKIIILLILAAGIALAVALPQTLDELKETVGTLPLTKHALEAHPGEYSPEKLQALISTYGCTEIEAYYCPVDNQCIVLCKLLNARWVGLICGIPNGQLSCVVTGFPARYEYWTKVVDGCSEMRLR